MKTETLKTNETGYIAPCVECIEVVIENGYQASAEDYVIDNDYEWDE